MHQRALELLRAGRADAAEAVLAAMPDDADTLHLRGLAARQRGDAPAAIAFYRRSLALAPAQPHVRGNLANVLLADGQHGAAIAEYRAALALAPDHGDARVNLGLALLADDDPATALIELEAATAALPQDARAWAGLGRALRAVDRLDEAIAAFARSLAIRPDHVATLHNLAAALRMSGDPTRAAALLERCIALDGAAADSHYLLGNCRQDLGAVDDAAAAYRAAIRAHPTHRAAHDSLNRLLWDHGRTSEYLASYGAALARDPNDAGLLADLGQRLNLGGRTADTIALLGDAVARGISDSEVRHRLGQALCAEGRTAEGLAQLDAAAIHPARLDAARARIAAGDGKGALASLEPVLAACPDDSQAIGYAMLGWRLTGDRRADLFDGRAQVCDFALEPAPAWGGVAAFNARLETVLARLHRAEQHPLEQTLRGGTQTMGDLFADPAPEIAEIRRLIEAAVARYIADLPDDPDHPLLRRKASGFGFAGSWSVRLAAQGFHLDHVHSEGWISSVYYVALPPSVAARTGDRGWLRLGHSGLLPPGIEPEPLLVRPAVGKLVLFPSYLYHGTIPFDDAGATRTTIAFDIVPQ
ncbi:tetratricopeptide repeat protein [Sphingomonas baiyangensis]|uniref:Tetratricopeptide repeat protein n=1 Tax=Sphingomonas baiyangensis TaxID=2572576 RepID=A0A4U1L549_9SPHN|nr:tetratricopeptide repeat protein [Sphingomonas baiyangensis]TKD51325.1 tetratricopeptide repeat protein [Sphingomonas baiyangensis]